MQAFPSLLSPPPPRTFLRPPQFSRGQKSEKCIERAESLTETLATQASSPTSFPQRQGRQRRETLGTRLQVPKREFEAARNINLATLGDPGAASRDDGIFMGESLQQERESPGHLLLPIQFHKRLNSLLLIGQKNIFLANQRRGTAGRLSCLLTRGCFPHQSP